MFNEIQEQYDLLRVLWTDYWASEVIFTFQWWTMVLILIIPIFLWWKLVDKSRLLEISMVGLFTSGIAFILDQIGTSLGLWIYPYTLTNLERDLWAVADFSLLPFFYMMFYQWFPRWKTYLLVILLFSLFAAFIGETIFQLLGIYKLLNWSHVYSVPGYFLLGLFTKSLVQKFKSIEEKSNTP